MVQIKSVKRITVTEQIMEQIVQLIRSGELKPGQQLPNERDLAEQFGVTRGRVREALRALSLVGLITIKSGEGSFVNRRQEPIPPETIVWMFHHELDNLDEVYAARRLIESEVYLTAAAHNEPQELQPLHDILSALPAVLNPEEPELFLDQLDRFDLHVGGICGNRIYAKLMQTIVYLRRETSIKLLRVPGAMENSIQNRTVVLEALEESSVPKMKLAVDAFFDQSKQFYQHIGESV
ncbi:FadR/GntR family transcriptional regulator [Paenibacillus solisilvae]|uniref:FadR/GntR family transcriptional regulator n=1 Tax=Paenibacillus solisilvae TaxID=2486751 RepID=A0ABW0WBI8_9BACL